MVCHGFNVHSLFNADYIRNALLRKADSPVEGTIKLMFSTIALIIIAIATCALAITYYCEREDLVRQLRDIDYSLSEMRASLNKLEHINNKLLAIENKVQTAIDRTSSVKTYLENDVTMHLSGIKAGQEIYISKFYSKTDKLQNTIDNLVKENAKKYQELINAIDKRIVDSETRIGAKVNTIIEHIDTFGTPVVIPRKAKNSSKTSKVNNTTEANKQENGKLKTAE